jgi:hypothetical protein
MRTSWHFLLLGCLATACGGNFSNDDLEFLNALPAREDLTSKLPEAEGSVSAGSQGQRSDPLALGERSQLYVDTRKVSDEFNNGLDGLLSLLESIRDLPPTQREPDRRIWGPWPDRRHPGHELRFVMTREAEHFDYQLQFRPERSSEEAWWTLVDGSFRAGGGLRKGEGTVKLLLSEAKAHGFSVGGLAYLERLDIAYQTRALPIGVQMRFVLVFPQLTPELRYAYREIPGGLGEMRFLLEDTDVISGGQREDLSIVSRWTREHGGVGIITVTGGDVPAGFTATHVECWDASFRVTYAKRSWETTVVGEASACPDVSELEN